MAQGNSSNEQNKTAQNIASSVISAAKSAATAAKAAGKAIAGDIAGAILDILKDENFRRIIASILIIAIMLIFGLSIIGPSITGPIQNLEQLYIEQYEALYQQHAIEANGNTFALYTFDTKNAQDEAMRLAIQKYIENLFAMTSKYDNRDLEDGDKTSINSKDYQNTLNSIKDKESLVGENGALQTRINLIKGRVEQRGEQLATIATAQYQLQAIGMAIQGLLHPDVPPNFMGYTPLIVTSGSMSPSFDADDLVIVKTVDDPTQIDAGEVISYFVGDALVTHRIVEKTSSEEHPVLYITQGDANNTPDRIQVVPDDIFGTYITHIDNIGSFALFMQTPIGMLCFVVIPIILLFAGFYIIDRKKYKDELKKQQETLAEQTADQLI